MSTIPSFKNTENKHDVYSGKDYRKNFSDFLREYAIKIIKFKKKTIKLITKEPQESYENTKITYIR